jgi:hypothetical protein
MEISFDTQQPAGERPRYIQVGDSLASQAMPKAAQRWFQEEGYRSYTYVDKSEMAYLDKVIPAPFIEQVLPYLALLAVLLGFIALGSPYPISFGAIILNPLLVSLYLHRRAERRQKARELIASTNKGRSTRSYIIHQGLEEQWRGASA